MGTLEKVAGPFKTLALLLENLRLELPIAPTAEIGILSRAGSQAAERVFQMHVDAISNRLDIFAAERIFPVALLVLLPSEEVKRRRQAGRHFLGLPENVYGSGYRFGEFAPPLDAIHAIRFLERQFIAHQESWEASASAALGASPKSRFDYGLIRFGLAEGDQAWLEMLFFLTLPCGDQSRPAKRPAEAAVL